jgi:hypothetical protein
MKKLSFVISLIIILFLIGGILYFSKNKTLDVINLPSREISTKTLEISPLIVEHASSTYAEIYLSYPKSSTNNLSEVFNFIQNTKNDFWNQYGNLNVTEAKDLQIREDNQYQLYVDTRVATSTKTISYLISVYQYTGGAHGMTNVTTFNYDSKGKILAPLDVFTPNYLEVLAPMARKYFYDTMGDYTQPTAIDSGTEPTNENYSSWYLTDLNVVFIFEEYQVGPYVLGIQEYPIPKNKIQDILQPTFR